VLRDIVVSDYFAGLGGILFGFSGAAGCCGNIVGGRLLRGILSSG
jgi:hypothetical protein